MYSYRMVRYSIYPGLLYRSCEKDILITAPIQHCTVPVFGSLSLTFLSFLTGKVLVPAPLYRTGTIPSTHQVYASTGTNTATRIHRGLSGKTVSCILFFLLN